MHPQILRDLTYTTKNISQTFSLHQICCKFSVKSATAVAAMGTAQNSRNALHQVQAPAATGLLFCILLLLQLVQPITGGMLKHTHIPALNMFIDVVEDGGSVTPHGSTTVGKAVAIDWGKGWAHPIAIHRWHKGGRKLLLGGREAPAAGL